MSHPDDHQLLGEYILTGSESAFASLVTRYINLVHSTALRSTGNPHHAQEISQAVFVILARKAAKLSSNVVLSGWLYQTTRLTAANFRKGESRRQRREQEAYMQSTLNEPNDSTWHEIAPLLEEAMGRLSETDRNTIVLRFFENKTSAEIGVTLRVNEETARKRINRALEKLRNFFTRRGVATTTAIIGGAISANSVHAAPAGLSHVVALTGAKNATISVTLTTLVKGTMNTMHWIKLKFAAGLGVSAILVAGIATVAVSQINSGGQLTPADIIKKSQDAYAALASYSDDGKVTGTVGTQTVPPHVFTTKLARPNLYWIGWQQNLGSFVTTGMVWSAGSDNFIRLSQLMKPQKYPSMKNVFATAAGVSGGASSTVPQTFFSLNGKNSLGALTLPAAQKPDQKIGDVDCYVISKASGGRTITVWIGKSDFLIRQVEGDVSAAAVQKTLQTAARQNPQISKTGISGDVVLVETHENIILNPSFSASDFAP